MIARLLCAFATAALPAGAEEANLSPTAQTHTGPVAQRVLAQDLYRLGMAGKDAVTVVAAARLAAGVALNAVQRDRTTSGQAAPDAGAAGAPLRAADMLAAARGLAGEDEALAALIDAAAAERPRITGVAATEATLAAGQTDHWQLAFFGQSHAELAVIGDGGSNLDLTVTDAAGAPVCHEAGPSDTALCAFVPQVNGYFLVSVRNAGPRANRYALLTN